MSAQSQLFQAARDNDVNGIAKALKEGAILARRNELGEDALLLATKHKAIDACRLLLAQGAMVDTQDQQLQTPLHWAVIHRHETLVELLLRFQASVTLTDINGKTAFDIARANQLTSVCAMFCNSRTSNYHADMLELRKNIQLIADEEDVISTLQFKLPLLLAKISESNIHELLTRIRNQMSQPEELLDWDQLCKKNASSSLLRHRSSSDDKRIIPALGITQDLADRLSAIQLHYRHPFFNKIHRLLEDFDCFFPLTQARKDETFIYLSDTLRKIKQHYLKFCHHVSEATVQTRVELCQGRLRVRGFFGFRYVNRGIALRFNSYFKNGPPAEVSTKLYQRRDVLFGTHPVLLMFDTFFKLHPTAPGIEHAVDSLNQIISGQCSTATELLVINKGPEAIAMIASKAVPGEVFVEVLKKRPLALHELDSFNYTAHVLLSLLVCPGDAKPDNFIATQNSLLSSFRLTGIDNDLAFDNAILFDHTLSEHKLGLKSIFFCLPQVDQPIDKAFRQAFIKQPAILIMLKWLKILVVQESYYLQYQETGEGLIESDVTSPSAMHHMMRQQEFANLHLPIKFAPGLFIDIYRKLLTLQDLFKTKPDVTHRQLLEVIYPAVARYYGRINSNYEKPLARMDAIYQNPPMPPLTFEKLFASEDVVKILMEQKSFQQSAPKLTVTLNDSCSDFLKAIDYRDLDDIYMQSYVLEKIQSDFPFLTELTFRHCEALNDERLATLAHCLPRLSQLTVSNCSQLNGSGFTAALCHHPKLKITLEGFGSISSFHLLHLLQYSGLVSLIIKGTSYQVSENQFNTLLQLSSTYNYANLTTAMLLKGAHLASSSHEKAPLHFATEVCNYKVVTELLAYGPPVNHEEGGKSALDVAYHGYVQAVDTTYKQDYQAIILALLAHGAITCDRHYAQFILALGLASTLATTHQPQLFQFARCNNLLNDKNIQSLIKADAIHLDLSAPPQFPRSTYVLNESVMNAIAKQAPSLTTLNIVGCEGLTPQLLRRIRKSMKSLTSIEVTFQQALDCQLMTSAFDQIESAHALQIKHIPINLSVLSLMNVALTPQHMTKIALFLEKTQHLKVLELVNCFTEKGVYPLCEGLKKNRSIDTLMINNNKLEVSGCNYFLEAVTHLPGLKTLWIGGIGLTAENSVQLAKFVGQSQVLSKLYLPGNSLLGNVGIENFVCTWQFVIEDRLRGQKKYNFDALTEIVVNDVGLEDGGVRALSRLLSFYKHLETFDIGYNSGLTDRGLEAVTELQEVNPRLKFVKAYGLIDETKEDKELNDQEKLIKKMITKISAMNRRNQLLYQKDSLHRYEKQLQGLKPFAYVQSLLPPEYSATKSFKAHLRYLYNLADRQRYQMTERSSQVVLSASNNPINKDEIFDYSGAFRLSMSISSNGISDRTLIFQGTYGAVYKGLYQYAPVCIRHYEKFREPEKNLKAVLHEGSVMASLRSPYIIQFYGVCIDKYPYALVSEYLSKGTLASVIHGDQSQAKVSWHIRLTMIKQIAYGLSYLHKQGIFHGDINSFNILVNEHYQAKLLYAHDKKINLSLQKPSDQNNILEEEGLPDDRIVSSIPWMAPELFSSNSSFSASSDIYSFGMVLWELCALQRPFQSVNVLEIIKRWKDGAGCYEKIPSQMPASLANLVQFCWERDVSKRLGIEKVVEILNKEEAQSSPTITP